MASRVILCLNSGSSSHKFALYRIGDGEELLLAQGAAELDDEQITRLWIHSAHEKIEKTGGEISSASTPLYALKSASVTRSGAARCGPPCTSR